MSRKLSHYLSLSAFTALFVGAYTTVVALVLLDARDMDPPVIASLMTSGVAVITGIMVLIKDPVMGWIGRPCLSVGFYPFDRRDCHATTFRDKTTGTLLADTQYFRLRIENVGWRTAEDVEVTLEEVEKFQDGRFVLDTQFMPLRLYWSHWREKRYELSIPPGSYRHCDFGFAIKPTAPHPPLPPQEGNQLQFWLDVFMRPNTGRTSLLPGRYRIKVSAFGRNATLASRTIEVTWNGMWYDSLAEMLENSLLVHAGFDTA